MRRAIITVGLGFGDEGKGATVDFLARRLEADLVVRYCGGSQAGHNVELPDGRRHTFSQFGAGTLAHASEPPRTYLGPNVIIDPLALIREACHLTKLGVQNPTGLITINPRCLVATPWLQSLNQLRELSRGDARHGSCGQGIGEARSYWLKYGEDSVFAADLRDLDRLWQKIELQRQRTLLELQEFIDQIDSDALNEFSLWEMNAEAVADDLHEALPDSLAIEAAVPAFSTAILEGAQGALLDEYRGFHPYTTWNTVTPHYAWELVEAMEVDAVALLGITRAYSTRHGEGPLPTFSAEFTQRLHDPGNPWNRWQGGMRCGWLDLPLIRYAAAITGPLDGIVVNHLDQVQQDECWLCDAYRNFKLIPSAAPHLSFQRQLAENLRRAEPELSPATPDCIVRSLSELAPIVIRSTGPTYEHRECAKLAFRSRNNGAQIMD